MLVPAIGIAVAIVRDRSVLFGRRIAAHGNGLFQLPGGKPDPDESSIQTAIREVYEETGLIIDAAVELARQVNDFPEVGKRYTTIFHGTHSHTGTPENREPDKCAGWAWYSLDELPGELFAIDPLTMAAIRAFVNDA